MALDALWRTGDPCFRDAVRVRATALLNHTIDPLQTWGQVVASVQPVECHTSVAPHRATGACVLCVECSRHTNTNVGTIISNEKQPGLSRVERLFIIKKLLLGRAIRRELKSLLDSMVEMSETLRTRQRVPARVAIDWLRSRRDLWCYAEMLTDITYLGGGAFSTSVAVITQWGEHAVLDLFQKNHVFSCCHKCASGALSDFKNAARYGTTDEVVPNSELFDWQYCTQMLGRYDHPAFADFSDLSVRQNFEEDNVVPNALSYLRPKFEEKFDGHIQAEGERFGLLLSGNIRARGGVFHTLGEMTLTNVPTGSIGKMGINHAAATEIPEEHINKKLAIAYLSRKEEEHIKRLQQHARSGWVWKLELAKQRNLVPGPLGLYIASARVSAYGENTFLATLKNCPLLWGEAHRQEDEQIGMDWQSVGYVADRDFKNYNACHTHKRMQMFYASAAKVAREQEQAGLADELEYIIRCLDDVGVYVDDEYRKWEYGMQTGWAHTMLFNCLFNSCSGSAVEEMMREEFGYTRYYARHQGDDSNEVWSHPLAGPIAQAILDSAGQAGQPTKQHFAPEVGSWSEFLRVWYKDRVACGSTIRSIGSFCSADAQHAPYEGGFGMLASIASGVNTVWRRAGGKMGWRPSDLACLCEYWAASNAQHKVGVAVDWRLVFREGGLMFGAYPEMQYTTNGVRTERRGRYRVEVGPVLLSRARRNLLATAPADNVEEHAGAYARDLLESSVAHSHIITAGQITGVSPPRVATLEEETVARNAVKACLKGFKGWQSEDKKAIEVTVGSLFGGSERVAREYLLAGKWPSKTFSERIIERIQRGLYLLAGLTCEDKPIRAEYYVCSEKYLGHIELELRRNRSLHVRHDVLGLQLARYAMSMGDRV